MTNQLETTQIIVSPQTAFRVDSSPHQASRMADAGVPAVRPLVYVLWITNSDAVAPSPVAQRLHHTLRERGHALMEASRETWRSALTPSANATSLPDVILLDPAGEFDRARPLCLDIKAEIAATNGVEVPLVVVSSPQDADESTADEMWAWWQSAGCDALVSAEIGLAELQSSLEFWARQSRLSHELKTLRETLVKQVQVDDLTGVLNRRFFFQTAHREVSRSRRYNHQLACLMVDINHLKLFNKTFGYACGDALLRHVAAIVRTWTRDSDIVARFGAKKFVILLPETDVSGAMRLHEKLQGEIDAQPFEWHQMPLPISISVGEAERHLDLSSDFSARPGHGSSQYEVDAAEGDEGTPISVREELADLLEDADAALYVAKKGVRHPSFHASVPAENQIIGILGAA